MHGSQMESCFKPFDSVSQACLEGFQFPKTLFSVFSTCFIALICSLCLYFCKTFFSANGPVFRCSDSDCLEAFSEQQFPDEHVKRKHQKKRFPCPQCCFSTDQKGNLKVHIANMHEKVKCYQQHLCERCGKPRYNLMHHICIHGACDSKEQIGLGHKPLTCNKCGKAFCNSGDLARHFKQFHDGHGKPFCCDTCGKEFAQRLNLKIHEKTHTGLKPFQCRFCDKHFAQSGHRLAHERVVHEKCYQYLCEMCGKHFQMHHNLMRHNRVHTGEQLPKAFLCATCGKAFRTTTHLKMHERFHTGVKPFQCRFCDRCFPQGSNRLTHERLVHEKIYLHHCKTCQKGFVSPSAVRQHERIHLKHKPFCCDTCGRGFTQRSSLKTHMQIHSGLKPFQCQFCGKCFTKSCNRLKHERAVHQKIYPHHCVLCHKGFQTPGQKKKHLDKMHASE